MTRVALAVALVFAFGCNKSEEKAKPAEPKPATAPTAPVAPGALDGARTVAIAVNENGYVPDRISGKPGEKLKLRFTRSVEGHCLSELKTPDGKVVALPMNEPFDVEVTVPADGEVKFACGMEMFFGVIVAEK
jgi:plastocyanin domain-containing protein